MKKKVILDCDPGSDDAVAIMLAWFSDDIDLMAITTVNGNRIVPKTTENALRMVQFLHAGVPVYRGCGDPIICNEIPSRKPNLPRVTLNDCHGDFLPLPEAKIQPQPEHAVFYLVRTLMESDGDIYVAATAPLTNIAMALRIEPRIAGKIKQLVIMGGAICGANASPSAEFNFYADPEAAKIVMDTDIPKVILPLDATWRACITEWVDANVDIEIMSGICDGRMVADIHNTKKGRDPVTARVALNADAAKFTAMLFENLGRK